MGGQSRTGVRLRRAGVRRLGAALPGEARHHEGDPGAGEGPVPLGAGCPGRRYGHP